LAEPFPLFPALKISSRVGGKRLSGWAIAKYFYD